MKIERVCEICGKKFLVKKYRVLQGNARYCSIKCSAIWRSKTIRGINSSRWAGGKKEFKCKLCGKLFYLWPGHTNKGIFCSPKCSQISNIGRKGKSLKGSKSPSWRGGGVGKECLICGKTFKVPNSQSIKGMGKFCSRKCFGIWESRNRIGRNSPTWSGGLISRECEVCGSEFKVNKAIVINGNGRFCSQKCQGINHSKTFIGAKVYNWKGGKIKRFCESCGKVFEVAPAHTKNGHGKFCSRTCSCLDRVSKGKNKDTSIELKMGAELLKRKVKFQKQYPIPQARTVPDFFIKPNICIFCDGDYWHNIPKTVSLNKNQNYWLNFLGYKVYRFWEHDINKSIKKCVDLIKEIR